MIHLFILFHVAYNQYILLETINKKKKEDTIDIVVPRVYGIAKVNQASDTLGCGC